LRFCASTRRARRLPNWRASTGLAYGADGLEDSSAVPERHGSEAEFRDQETCIAERCVFHSVSFSCELGVTECSLINRTKKSSGDCIRERIKRSLCVALWCRLNVWRDLRHVIPPFPSPDALGIFALDQRQASIAEEHTQRRLGGIDDSEQRGCSRFRIAWRGCRAEGTDAYAFSRDRMTAAVTQLLERCHPQRFRSSRCAVGGRGEHMDFRERR
jgi:hypothetical protein